MNCESYIQQPIAQVPSQATGTWEEATLSRQTFGRNIEASLLSQTNYMIVGQGLAGASLWSFQCPAEKKLEPEINRPSAKANWLVIDELLGPSVFRFPSGAAMNVGASRVNWESFTRELACESPLLFSACELTAASETESDLRLINAHWEQFDRAFVTPSVLASIQNAYVIVNREKVASFIEQNQLSAVLQAAREPLVSAFGQTTIKTLTLVEDDEGASTLFCLVMYPGDMQEARQALRTFDNTWWLQRSKRFASKLNFDFELI